MRHGPAETREGLSEGIWIIVAAETDINPVLTEKRLTNDTAKKAWTIPCSKTEPFKELKLTLQKVRFYEQIKA